jgi:hypothetical protein
LFLVSEVVDVWRFECCGDLDLGCAPCAKADAFPEALPTRARRSVRTKGEDEKLTNRFRSPTRRRSRISRASSL